MHKLFLILGFTFFIASTQAQYQKQRDDDTEIKRHQISVNGAESGIGYLFKLSGNLKLGTDSLGYKGRSSTAFQLAYDYHFKKNVSLGILLSTQSMGMQVDYLIFKNPNNITRRFNNIDIGIKRQYIGLRFHYHLINNSHNDLYLGARLGGVFWQLSPSITDTDLDNKLNTGFPGVFFPALAFGYKYKIKERVGLGLELSVGNPQLFSYGIDYRF